MSNLLMYPAVRATTELPEPRNVELEELLAELAEMARTAGDLPLPPTTRITFSASFDDDELTLPFVAVPIARVA